MKRLWSTLRDESRRLTAGFTLVELMVALTGGLFVSVAVFMLARQATGLYQSEARVSNATLGSVVGFERLRLDIERAAFLASPNVRRDPALCGRPDASWPAYLARMSSVFIQPTPNSSLPAVLIDNKIKPDELVLAGSYTSIDQFWTRSIDATGGAGAGHVVTLEPSSPAMARLGYQNATTATAQATLLQSVFPTGRAMRIVDTQGHEQYGTIASVAGGAVPTVLLEFARPSILYRGASADFKCGVMGNGKDHLVNTVNFVKYSLRNLSGLPRYAPLYQATVGTGAPTDVGRTELVREELDVTGTTITDSEEVISEFAVDLRFGISIAEVSVPSGNAAPFERLRSIPPEDVNVVAWAGDPTTIAVNQGPQRIRAVRARLSVRSREADRLSGIPTLTDGGGLPIAGGGLYRIGLGAGGAAPFARVRTVQADIALRNHRGVAWL